MSQRDRGGFRPYPKGRGQQIPALLLGDNLRILRAFPSDLVDLAYLDPPFFTRKQQRLFDRTLSDSRDVQLSFSDIWSNHKEYLEWIRLRIEQVRRVLKPTGSVFLHCDWHASHLLRVILDEVFQPEQFRSEIVWSYKRWSNNSRTFQRAHQVIFFYSKTRAYKFHPLYDEYSFTTNIDQIWQKRGRDENGRSITVTDQSGSYVPLGQSKLGVPMRDVWDIPYLNPRSKERTGWPTQKPLALLRRIILATTDARDVVLDPVCGSGTTLVAAKALGRSWIGIDSSRKAIAISRRRLQARGNPFEQDIHHAPYRISQIMKLSELERVRQLAPILGMHLVHRNSNFNGFLKRAIAGSHVPVKFIDHDRVEDAIGHFAAAAEKKLSKVGVVIVPRLTADERRRWEDTFRFPVRILIVTYDDLCRKGFSLEGRLHGKETPLGFRRDHPAERGSASQKHRG